MHNVKTVKKIKASIDLIYALLEDGLDILTIHKDSQEKLSKVNEDSTIDFTSRVGVRIFASKDEAEFYLDGLIKDGKKELIKNYTDIKRYLINLDSVLKEAIKDLKEDEK